MTPVLSQFESGSYDIKSGSGRPEQF